MLPKTLFFNTRSKNSFGKRLLLVVSLHSLNLVKIQEKNQRTVKRPMLMGKKKKMKPSNGWLIRFYKVFKLRNQILISSMRKLLTSPKLSIKFMK